MTAPLQPELPITPALVTESGAARDESVPHAVPDVEPEKFSPSEHQITRTRLSGEQLDRWAGVYGTQHRQLRRWVKRGEATADPCPLDDPERMPEWWARQMRWGIPDKIASAAADAKQHRLATEVEPLPALPVTAAAPLPLIVPPPVSVSSAIAPMLLANFDMADGVALQNQRRLVGALFDKLERKYRLGESDADVTQAQYLKAQEALRKLEISEREAQKLRGLLVPRAAIERDLATGCEMLRQMRESMVRRVEELCPGVPREFLTLMSEAILRVRSQEDRVFANLATLRETDVSRRAA